MASVEERVAALEARVAKLEASQPADDSDLDSQWGNPTIRKDPPKWEGESYEGKTYSQCSPEYLRSLAGFLKWKADKNAAEADPQKQKYAGYDRRDASRALGWAKRIEARQVPAAVVDDPYASRSDAPPPGIDPSDPLPF